MPQPQRDPEYSSPVWASPHDCPHPRDAVLGIVIPRQSMMEVSCLKCGGSWKDIDNMPRRIFTVSVRNYAETLTRQIASGTSEVSTLELINTRNAVLELIGDEGY